MKKIEIGDNLAMVLVILIIWSALAIINIYL